MTTFATSDPEECEPPTEPPSYTEPPAPTYGGKGCCAGNSPRTWSFCGTLSDDEAMCHEAEECTWIPTEDPYSDECQPPTEEPTPVPTPLPTHDTKGCCAGTAYDIHSWTFCAKFDNGDDCEAAPVCEWNGGEYAECEPPTEPPAETEPPAPTHSGEGCCYGDGIYAAFCFSLDEERPCSGAPNCEWLETDDPTECEPTTTSTTPAPVYEEGCCTGYSARTFSFCNGIDNGAECESAGVCSWIVTEDPEECQPPTEPPHTTMPPAPTFGPGCCAGNSPRTWSFCMNIDEVRNCMEADECSWIEGDPYSPECTPPTPEPTPSTTPGVPTEPPTDEVGCCYGSTPSTNTFCSAMDDNKRACDANSNCEFIVTDDPSECELTTTTAPPSPTYSVEGCCTGYSARTFSFCNEFESGAECESAGVCSWIEGDDPEECSPPTEPPSFTEPPAPTYGGSGCCTGNSPRTWSFCSSVENEAMCVEAAECTWIATEDPYSDECQPPTKDPTPLPTPLPTHDTKGCCAGTAYDIHSWTFCAKFDNGDDCEAAPVCEWNGGEYAECEPPTEPPAETEPPAPTHSGEGCCYGDGIYAAFCFSLDEE